jgi:outer membrane receptor protein involved in Fe transport
MTNRTRAGTRRVSTIHSLAAALLAAGAATAQEPPPPEGGVALDLDVIARRLDIARTEIQPRLGATVYDFGRQAIETQPQGDNQPLNQLILQAPGVSQDSFGQIHVRGDHANLQFRLNGVQLPEGINVFGQALQTRLANSVALITGALPAQYGLRTAGIIDIQTKTGTLDPGGSATIYGGSHSWLQPSAEFGGRVGQVDYYATGEWLHNAIGIENPTPSYIPIHDLSNQPRGFAYVSGIIDPNTRLTGIFGASGSQFQIPNIPGLTPGLGLTVDGATDFPSAGFSQGQRQVTSYEIITLQKRAGPVDFQISAFNRYSSVNFTPGNPLGPILFTGIAQSAFRRDIASGLQGDGSWRISPEHTLRSGFYILGERSTFRTDSAVLPVDDMGIQTSDQSISILDRGGKTGWLYSYYLQDEWKLFPTVTLNFGARFDLMDQFLEKNQLSPRANLVWQPTDTTTFTVGYARYFVPPQFELVSSPTIGLFANTTVAPAITQSTTPKPERDHYFDIGASQIILPGLKAGVDAYYKIASDLLDEGQFGAPIILTPFNYQKGLLKGIEVLLSYDIDNWSFYGNFAASQNLGKNITSAQFNFQPEEFNYIGGHYIHTDHDQTYTYSAGIKYRWPTSGTRIAADLIAGSGLRATNPGGVANGAIPNGNSLPSYQQVNLSIVQPIPTGFLKGTELRFDIINLLDQIYQIRNGSGVGVGNPQFGPRRTFLAGLTQRF